MTLQDIFDTFTPGSQGFIDAVNTHCGFNMSDEEIERIGKLAKNSAEFEEIWSC